MPATRRAQSRVTRGRLSALRPRVTEKGCARSAVIARRLVLVAFQKGALALCAPNACASPLYRGLDVGGSFQPRISHRQPARSHIRVLRLRSHSKARLVKAAIFVIAHRRTVAHRCDCAMNAGSYIHRRRGRIGSSDIRRQMKRARKSGNGVIATLGDMRAKKARSLLVFCKSCAATRILNVDQFPDTAALAWFEPHLVCKRCGGKTSAAPHWKRR